MGTKCYLLGWLVLCFVVILAPDLVMVTSLFLKETVGNLHARLGDLLHRVCNWIKEDPGSQSYRSTSPFSGVIPPSLLMALFF